MIARRLLSTLLLLSSLAAVRASDVRVAVLASDDPDAGSLLEAELGKSPGIVLVERDEIGRIAREQAAAAATAASPVATGRLLHADVLVALSRVDGGEAPLETVRLVAVQPGVVIDSAVLAPDRSLLASEIARVAAQFAPLLAKTGALDPSSAVKVSLLGLRFDANAPSASGVERTLNALLADRLTHRPRIVVLERWNLNAAAWEKDLQADEAAPFWAGSCLVDGRISRRGGHLAVEARLRQAPDAPPLVLSLDAASGSVADLADSLAGKIAEAVGAPEAAFSWDRREEAVNETFVAHWALGNRLYRDAFEAAATADALCPRVPDIDLLRLECEAQLSFPRPPFVDTRTWTPYSPSRDGVPELPSQLEAAQAALDHLRSSWTLAGSDPAFQPAANRLRTQAVYTVQQASRLLSAVQANGSWHGDEEGFAELRQKIRDMVEAFLGQDASFQVRFGARLFAFAPYWFETPAETLAFYRRIVRMPANPAFPSPLAYGPSRWNGPRPWLVGWHGETQADLDAAWKAFLDSLRASPSLPDQIAGRVWQVKSAPFGERGALLPALADFAWTHRDEAARPDASADLSPLGEILADSLGAGPGRDDPSVRRIAADFLPALFACDAWIRPRTLHAFGLVSTELDPDGRDRLALAFAAYRAAMAGSPSMTDSSRYELDRVSRDIFGVASAPKTDDIHFPARFVGLAGDDGTAANLRTPVAADGRVWFIDTRLHRVVGWNPDDASVTPIPFDQPLGRQFPGDLAVGSRYVFVQASDQIWEYDRSTGAWRQLDLPPARYSPATTGGHAALLSWQLAGEKEGGGLLSVDPATLGVETVLSGRSNPPRNELDGRPNSRGLSLHLADDGRMDYVVKLSNSAETLGMRGWDDCHDDFYTQWEPGGPWERVLSVASTFARVCHLSLYPAPEGAVLLTRYRLGSTALSSFGQLVAWDRATGRLTLLLSNPATDRPPVPGVARWEMPPDLACTEATPHVWVVPALQDGTLWVLRWDGLEKLGMQHPAVYRFRPGTPQGDRLALDFDPAQGVPDGGARRQARFLRPENVAAHASGFVLDRSPEWGVWYLSFAEMNAALDGKGRP